MEGSKKVSSWTQSPPSPDINSCHDNTPGTALTQFSPDVGYPGSIDNSITGTMQPPAFALQVTSSVVPNSHDTMAIQCGVHDPFTTPSLAPSANTSCPRLSPTAAAFTPSGMGIASVKTRSYRHSLSSDDDAEKRQDLAQDAAEPKALESAVAPRTYNGFISQTVIQQRRNAVDAIMDPPDDTSELLRSLGLEHERPRGTSQLTTARGDLVTRYLKVSNIARTTGIEDLNKFLNVSRCLNHKTVVVSHLAGDGVVFIHYTDVRDAQQSSFDLQMSQPSWRLDFLTHGVFIKSVGPHILPSAVAFEGQVMAAALCDGPRSTFDVASVLSLMRDLLSSFGQLIGCDPPASTFPTVALRAEFCDSADAQRALGLDGVRVAGLVLSIKPLSSYIAELRSSRFRRPGPIIVGQDDDGLYEPPNGCVLQNGHRTPGSSRNDSSRFGPPSGLTSSTPTSDNRHVSPITPVTARTFVEPTSSTPSSFARGPLYQSPFPALNGSLTPGTIGQERIEHIRPRARSIYTPQQHRGSPKHRSTSDYASGHHNVVDINRIRHGLDVRTTIMLRNIPNKIDQAMLKGIVDETSHGQYDFMYLRIDFANNCNVGYAFINFEDPWFIIDFVLARAGRRWNRFNSDKVAEVSYATIQGKDCLVQKFRNSSVMLEHPSFRPKIFFTGDGPLAGMEDVFPGPDNPSKMRRSIENAEHVGLFAPRAGQHFRDEQRRRRSQYDRGTRLAELEESLDSGNIQQGLSIQERRFNGSHDCYQHIIDMPR